MTRERVIVTWWPERAAELLKRGEQVSEIRWLDDGSTRYMRNRHLEIQQPEEEPSGKQRKK